MTILASERVVVDASVGVKWFLPEADSERARTFLARAARGQMQLLAPDTFPGEAANAIWRRCLLAREISEVRARDAVAQLLAILPEIIPSERLILQAFELALRFRRPIYDCIYVALAMRERCPLITADGPMAQTFGRATSLVIHLDALELGS